MCSSQHKCHKPMCAKCNCFIVSHYTHLTSCKSLVGLYHNVERNVDKNDYPHYCITKGLISSLLYFMQTGIHQLVDGYLIHVQCISVVQSRIWFSTFKSNKSSSGIKKTHLESWLKTATSELANG